MHPFKYGDYHLQPPQLMDDGGSSSVFLIPNQLQQQQQQQQQSVFHNYPSHSLQQKQHQNVFQQQQNSVPVITHQLFQQQQQQQQHHHHQFQPFLQQQAETVPQPFVAVDFKLGLNENSGRKEAALALNQYQQKDAVFLHGYDEQRQLVPENRRPHQHSLSIPQSWQDSPIQQPFWKPLNRCEYTSDQRSKNLDDKYRVFGELEAIYGVAKGGETTQAAGSGSALTAENSRANVGLSIPLSEFQAHNLGIDGVAAGNAAAVTGVDHGSETSIGKEASLRKIQKKKKMKNKMTSMAVFFESLVRQVTDHQEGLHRRLIEVIERMDKERSEREESWRRQEAEKRNREAIARADEQALASSREALIVSYLEKITGQNINLPGRPPAPETATDEPFNESIISVKFDNNIRWPRAEVEALVQMRCNLESKFQKPGSKGPLWEEVSSLMASFGYNRSAKRCKEKWENLKIYFRKCKADGKKRSQLSKTCSYFDQLDQLYSRIPIASPNSPTPLMDTDIIEVQQQAGDSDFLEAYMPLTERDLGSIAQVDDSENLKSF